MTYLRLLLWFYYFSLFNDAFYCLCVIMIITINEPCRVIHTKNSITVILLNIVFSIMKDICFQKCILGVVCHLFNVVACGFTYY